MNGVTEVSMQESKAAWWGQEKKPLGYGIWNTWGDWLDLPAGAEGQKAAAWYAKNVMDGTRMMTKFEWWDLGPDHPQNKLILKQAQRCRNLGMKVHLVIDWFNEATGPDDYHARIKFPKDGNIPKAVREIIEYFGYPEVVEVCNEPYYKKNDKKWLSTHEYRGYVDLYVQGIKTVTPSDYKPLLVATQTTNGNKVADGWEWHVAWDRCAEGKHYALHNFKTYDELEEALHPADFPRTVAVGWRWGRWYTEISPVGRHTHINSEAGAELTRAVVDYGKRRKGPVTHLTMGGYRPDWGGGVWGMHTDLVDDLGRFSRGAAVYAASVGVDVRDYDGGIIIEPPPPPPDPGFDPFAGIEPATNAIRIAANSGMTTRELMEDPKYRLRFERWRKAWRG